MHAPPYRKYTLRWPQPSRFRPKRNTTPEPDANGSAAEAASAPPSPAAAAAAAADLLLLGLPRDVLLHHVLPFLPPPETAEVFATSRRLSMLAADAWRVRLGQLAGERADGRGTSGDGDGGDGMGVADWKRAFRMEYYMRKRFHEGAFAGHRTEVSAAAAVDDGSFVTASLDEDGGGSIELWDASTGERVRSFAGHANAVFCLERFGDGVFLSCSRDGTAKMWSVETGECVATYSHWQPGRASWPRALARMSDFSFVAVSGDGVAKVWDANTGKCVRTMKGTSMRCDVWSVARMNERVFLTIDNFEGMILRNALTGQRLHSFVNVHGDRYVCAMCVDERTFLSITFKGELKLWNFITGECIKTVNLGSYFSRLGCRMGRSLFLFVSASRRKVELFDLMAGEITHTMLSSDRTIWSLARINEVTFVVGHDNGTAKVWKIPAKFLQRSVVQKSSA